MAIKATVYKAALQIADMDRGLYADHALTLALQPSETTERLMMRLMAFALQVPADDHGGALLSARGLAEADEPDLWQHDLTGQLMHGLEVGQPDERRMAKACGRARRVSIYAYGTSAPVWWAGLQGKRECMVGIQAAVHVGDLQRGRVDSGFDGHQAAPL